MKIYYAHCLSIYDAPQEKRDLEVLKSLGFEVVNPNCPECAEGYKKEGMDYFRRYAEECEAIAFRALPDGRIPAGIGKEIRMFKDRNKPAIELPSGLLSRLMSIEETREYLMETCTR